MSMARAFFGGWLACLTFVSIASRGAAEISAKAADGFVAMGKESVGLPPGEAYKVFVEQFSEWYDVEHTYTGKKQNLALDLKRACLLERLPQDGFVRHMEVVFHQPGKVLRLSGGLGPLQAMGVSGMLTFEFKPTEKGCMVSFTYFVSGAKHLKLDQVAGPVDQVLNSQIARFSAYCKRQRKE